MNQKIESNQNEYDAFLFILVVGGILLILMLLFCLFLSCVENSEKIEINYNECEITNVNAENNVIEYACKNDLKIMRKLSDITTNYDEWGKLKETLNCRLVKINATVNRNQSEWLCDKNISIYNDFYK